VSSTPEDVVHDLRVLTAVEDGDDVIVSVYGGRANVCGTVRFTYPGASDRRETTVRLTERWAASDELVTLLVANGNVSLFSERNLFDRAFAPSP
jgi:hypothetical protein